MTTMERRRLVCSLSFHVIAISCVIWSLYVLTQKMLDDYDAHDWGWGFWLVIVRSAYVLPDEDHRDRDRRDRRRGVHVRAVSHVRAVVPSLARLQPHRLCAELSRHEAAADDQQRHRLLGQVDRLADEVVQGGCEVVDAVDRTDAGDHGADVGAGAHVATMIDTSLKEHDVELLYTANYVYKNMTNNTAQSLGTRHRHQ